MSDRQFGSVVRIVHSLFSWGTAGGLTDGQLLQRFASRNEDESQAAFAGLVERHGPMILRVCRSILRNEQDAEDAFQATFLVLARKAGKLWTSKSLGPWLYGVAFRTASCARSSRTSHQEHQRRAAESMSRVVVIEIEDDLGPVLHAEINRLPVRYRDPILLCYFEGLTHEQAARQLDWPVGTVRSRLARARALLRERLTRRGLAPETASLSVICGKIVAPPDRLIELTVKAATLRTARDALEAGLVSASVSAMTEGVFQTMLVSKLKTIAATLLTIGAVASAMGLYASQSPDPAAKLAPDPAAAKPIGGRNADILGDHAADLEELLRRVRQEQARGDIEAAMRDLHRIERVAARWRLALAHRTNQGTDFSYRRPTGKRSASIPVDTDLEPVFISVTRGQMDKLADEMMSTDLELFKVESELAALESATRADEKDPVRESKQHEEQLERRIREEFVSDPDIVALGEEIATALEQRDHAKSVAQQANDPARRAAAQKYDKLMNEYERLWEIKRKEIGKRPKAGTLGPHLLESINDLKLKLQTLKAQKSKQAEYYRKLKIDEKGATDDAFEASFLKNELKDLLNSDDHLKTNFQELEVKTSQENRSSEAPKPGSTEDRLGQLERKIDRLILALGKDLNEKLGPAPTGKSANTIAPPPPDLLGRITKIDSRAGVVEINIGSDDGLVPSHELSIYRVDPAKQVGDRTYLGRIRISGADPDQSVGKVLESAGKTKIKVGDQVSPRHPSGPDE